MRLAGTDCTCSVGQIDATFGKGACILCVLASCSCCQQAADQEPERHATMTYTELQTRVTELLDDCQETEALSLIEQAYEAEEIMLHELRQLEGLCDWS